MSTRKSKIITILLVAVYALTLLLGLPCIFGTIDAFAVTNGNYPYYYDNLITTDSEGKTTEYTLAKKFYRVLEELNDSGDFKDGIISYELTDMLTSEQIKAWVENGDLEIPRAFGAARDSFLMDHPELFYIDVYKIMISAGRTNGNYVAYIDCGKEANIYRDKSFKTEDEVNKAINEYNAAVKKIADEAAKKTEGTTSKKDFATAIAVNEIIANNTYYDFGTYNGVNNTNVSTASMAFTAYGALVYNKAVCSGYSLAYKAVMDYLNIPCIMVSGYSVGKDKKGNDLENNVGHSWNYVLLETNKKTVETEENVPATFATESNYEWFAFDTTWNSVQREVNKYSAMDYITASKDHMAYGVISSSNYSLRYPSLCSVSYDKALDPSKMDTELTIGGFNYKAVYIPSETTYETRTYISYNGKNAQQLLASENMRMVTRTYLMNPQTGEKYWTQWQDLVNSSNYQNLGVVNNETENNTFVLVIPYMHKVQFAVVSNIQPDVDVWSGGSENVGFKMEKVVYSENAIKEENFVFMSQELENATYGSYTAPPYILTESTNPYMGCDIYFNDGMSEGGDSSIMQDKHATTITLKYDEPLHQLDLNKPIMVNVSPNTENAKQYCGFVKFSDGEYVHLLEDENGVKNTLQFKFKPSLMYEHNRIGYVFTFENIGSSKLVEKKAEDGTLVKTTSDKAPNYAYYVWSRMYMACPKVFGDGRLWVDCCAQPVLADNSDLSAMDFKDENGNSTFSEAERSQMMLVVNNMSSEAKNEMLDEISNDNSNNIKKNDIKASQTYDIQLQICGRTSSIPDGSYVKIALGFPQGYGPDDEGVTFKLFHRKHIKGDEYIIEEIPCVVTKFGIVATVTSFSPYMVAVVPEEKATTKTVYASIDGKGGKLTLDDGQIQTVKKGGSYTYTISPDEGYKLYNVTLNGKSLTERVTDGKLTLTYDELTRNNELEIQYISEEASQRYAEKNIVDPVKVVVSADNKTSNIYSFVEGEVFAAPSNTTLIIVGVVIAIIAAAAAVLTIFVVVRERRKEED